MKHLKAADFLMSDLGLALAMLDRAATTMSTDVAQRNIESAKRACDKVEELLQRGSLTPAQRKPIDERLAFVRERLKSMAPKRRRPEPKPSRGPQQMR